MGILAPLLLSLFAQTALWLRRTAPLSPLFDGGRYATLHVRHGSRGLALLCRCVSVCLCVCCWTQAASTRLFGGVLGLGSRCFEVTQLPHDNPPASAPPPTAPAPADPSLKQDQADPMPAGIKWQTPQSIELTTHTGHTLMVTLKRRA